MTFESLDDYLQAQSDIGYADYLAKMENENMTDLPDNFNNDPRECLAHYAARRPDSLMGYRPAMDNELTRHFVALGALEWKSIEGVRYCKLTPDGQRMLEQYLHGDTRAQLDAANARIAALETVCREVIRTHFDEGPSLERQKSLLALLDTLPPSA
jgi:hypothetical protein